jgi:hypothetical protein
MFIHRTKIHNKFTYGAAQLILVFAASTARADVTLVQDGQAKAKIHVAAEVMADVDRLPEFPKNPGREAETQRQRLRESVKDLALYLGKMSGATVEIVTAPPAAGDAYVPILIGGLADAAFGATQKTAPFKQGFRYVVSPKGIGLGGESDLATSYAIYELLDRLGCRWFMPSDQGEEIPALATITLAETDESLAPGTIYRGIWYADEAYRRRNRCGGLALAAGHALEGYITAEDRQQHPEWKAEIGGQPNDVRLRWSNAELANTIADRLLARHADDPQPSYSLSPDDGASFDESADDRAIDAGDFDPTFQGVSITDRLMVLTNRVAERFGQQHPDVLFGVLAYVNYTRPPVREKVHPNVVPMIAPITYSRAHPMTDDRVPGNKDLRYLVEGWGKASEKTSVYFYAYNLAETTAPNPLITKWGVDVPIVMANGCKFWQPETLSNFETTLHGLYLGLRLAWNPALKPDDVFAELNGRFYGAAAPQMTAYWKHIDHVWVDTPEYSGCGFAYLRRWTPEQLAEARRLMDAAVSACQTPAERFRVSMADESLRQFELFMKLRRDLAEGRYENLAAEAAQWRERHVALGEQYKDQYAFCRVPWTPHTVGGAYFAAFYQATYDDATRIARDYQFATPPLRAWKFLADEKKQGEAGGQAKADFDDSQWRTTDPCVDSWSALGHHDYFGSMWYRTTARFPAPGPGKRTRLWVGATDGSVKVYINGQHIPYMNDQGQPADEFNGYCQPVSFDITDAIKPGEDNQIALYCTRTFFNELGTGGLIGPVAVYQEK